jgi:tetratricopeptide (TPR) repeat protein
MRSYLLAMLTFLGLTVSAGAQNIVLHDPPTLYVAKQPPTRRDIELRHSLYKYVDGLQLMHEEHYSDALRAFEEAARLDPDAPAIVKAQIPILVALDRYTDALAASKKVTDLDPDDFSTWFVQAKLQKAIIRYADAIASLERGVKSPQIKNHPEAAQQMYLDLGGLYENAEKFAPAADAFNKAAAILEHPDRIAEIAHVPLEAVKGRAAETYERIGQLYRKAKQYDDAIAALSKAKDRAPERAGRFSYLLAQICDEAGQPKQALAHLDVYVRTQPLGIEPYEMKVNLLRRLKQPEAIVPWLEEAAQRDRFNNALLLLLARECASAKEPRKAETVYKKLAEDSPSTELYRGLFNLYKDEGPAGMSRILGMLDKAMDQAAREDGRTPHASVQHAKAMVGALREDGDLSRRVVETAFKQTSLKTELKFDTLYFLAVLADKHRQTEEAERFYRQCLRDKKAQGNEPILYNGLLRTLMKARKHEAVVELCQQGLKEAKTTNPLLFYGDLARAQAGLKHYDEALKTVESALAQPGASDLMLKMLRVRILAMAERFDTAETEGKALIKTYQKPAESVELHYLLSNVYAGAKRQADAEAELQTILKIDPDNPTVNNDLGYLWADQNKNLAIAEDMIRKALEVDRSQRRRNPNLTAADDKDNAAYVDSLGWVLFRRGQIEEAKKELERAVTLEDGADPTIYEHLGDVYSRLAMPREARRAWQRAVELYKDGIRGNDEERVRELQRKIGQVKAEVGGR